jgi:hypothetical protein
MFFLRFSDHDGLPGEARETAFLTAAREAGVLFKRGAYDYPALAHDAAAVALAGDAAHEGFRAVRALEGVPA